jgi:hypothetical protein
MNRDLEHLKLLEIFHYIVGGLLGLCACFPIIHLVIGLLLVTGKMPQTPGQPPPPEFLGWFFVILAPAVMILGWMFAIATVLAGQMLRRHRGYIYCMVVAALACLWVPWGTVLGVFTILVLCRPSVKELFERANRQSGAPEIA